MDLVSVDPLVLPAMPPPPAGLSRRPLDPVLDTVLCIAPPDAFQLGWDEPPTDALFSAPPEPSEDPSLVQTLRYGSISVPIRTMLEDVYREVRASYVADGRQGLATLLRLNPANPSVGPFTFDPSLLVEIPEADPQRAALFALIRRSCERIEDLGGRAVELVGAAAGLDGAEMLAAAQGEIASETGRYQTSETGGALSQLQQAVLDLSPALAGLNEILRQRAEIVRQVAKNEARLYSMAPPGALPPVPNLERLLTATPAYQTLEAKRRTAALAIAGAVGRRAPTMPILWRLYDHPEAHDVVRLRELALDELATAQSANEALADRLRQDSGLVWRYPVLVRQAMIARHVPQASVAWRAVEEKLAEENPTLRGSAQLSILTGLATLAVPGLGASVALGPVGPFLASAIVAADIAAALWDSFEEWLAYRNERDAHQAVLNPALSWASPPSLAGAIFSIGMNLLSAVPGSGAGRAAK